MNSKGTADDVTPDVKAYFDYVNGVISDDAFVREAGDEISRVKQIEQERVSYSDAPSMNLAFSERNNQGFRAFCPEAFFRQSFINFMLAAKEICRNK